MPPEPELYVAVPPLFSASVGLPVTVTFSLKVIVIGIRVPDGYVPSALVEVTLVTVGAVVS